MHIDFHLFNELAVAPHTKTCLFYLYNVAVVAAHNSLQPHMGSQAGGVEGGTRRGGGRRGGGGMVVTDWKAAENLVVCIKTEATYS